MFDVRNCVKTRYFEVKLYDENQKGVVFHVEPPKVKTLKKMITISNKKDLNAEEFRFVVCSMLEKNKENIRVERYVSELTIDQLKQVFTAFMEWLNESKQEKN